MSSLSAGRYRKRPVVVEAILYDGSNESISAVSTFMGRVLTIRQHRLSVDTLEGTMYANRGDWIVKGVQGEFYPVKPDIFEQTYEAVDA